MGFSFFKSKQNSKTDDKQGSSFLNKIHLNNPNNQNKAPSFDRNNEPSFEGMQAQNPQETMHTEKLGQTDLFANLRINDINVAQETVEPPEDAVPQNQDMQNQVNLENIAPQEEVPNVQTDDGPKYYVGPSESRLRREQQYYTYKANSSYLNEAGRDSDHLYISPGESFKKFKENQKPQVQEPIAPQAPKTVDNRDLFSTNSNVQGSVNLTEGKSMYQRAVESDAQSTIDNVQPTAQQAYTQQTSTQTYQSQSQDIDVVESSASIPSAHEDVYTQNVAPQINQASTTQQEQNLNTQAQYTESIAQNNQSVNNTAPLNTAYATNNVAPQQAPVQPQVQTQVQPQTVAQATPATDPNAVNTQDNRRKDNQGNEVKPQGLSPLLYIWFFIRQFFASFFNYTNLGVIFSRPAMVVLGPSTPGFMPIPFFFVGFICAAVAMGLDDYTKAPLTAALVLVVYLLLTGCNAFRGVGNLLVAISYRKPDGYSKAVICILMCILFDGCFQYYVSEPSFVLDVNFCIGFGVIAMLSALTATTLNFGLSDDPVSTYGVLSLPGLILITIFTLVITFLVLDWTIALSMVGICIFCRVVIGQFMYLKGIKTSINSIAAAQYLTLILLMLDLLLAKSSFGFMSVLMVDGQ